VPSGRMGRGEDSRSSGVHAPHGLHLGEPLGDVRIVGARPAGIHDPAVLRVASIADDDRRDATRENEVCRRNEKEHGHEPDSAEAPGHTEGDGRAGGEDRAAEALVEILLDEERRGRAAGARIDPLSASNGVRVGKGD